MDASPAAAPILSAPVTERCYRAIVPIPRRYTTDAIVLSRFDFGEADRILTLITPGSGKLKAIAKGIRRPTSRIGGSLVEQHRSAVCQFRQLGLHGISRGLPRFASP